MRRYSDAHVCLVSEVSDRHRTLTVASVANPPLDLLPVWPGADPVADGGEDPLEPWNVLRALADAGAEMTVYWPVASAEGRIWLRPLCAAWDGRLSPEQWLHVYRLACRTYPTEEIAVVALARRYAEYVQDMADAWGLGGSAGVNRGDQASARWRRPADRTTLEQALSLLWWRFALAQRNHPADPTVIPNATRQATHDTFLALMAPGNGSR